MKADTRELERTAQELRRFAGAQYNDFLKAMDAHAARLVEEVLEALPEQLTAAQAKAKAIRSLIEVLKRTT